MSETHDHEYCIGPDGSLAPDCPDFDPGADDSAETDRNTDPYAIGSPNPMTLEVHR